MDLVLLPHRRKAAERSLDAAKARLTGRIMGSNPIDSGRGDVSFYSSACEPGTRRNAVRDQHSLSSDWTAFQPELLHVILLSL